VKYDLIGKIATETKLTRATVGSILHKISPKVFAQYRTNPEDFNLSPARKMNFKHWSDSVRPTPGTEEGAQVIAGGRNSGHGNNRSRKSYLNSSASAPSKEPAFMALCRSRLKAKITSPS
jgi:hypothetical protein